MKAKCVLFALALLAVSTVEAIQAMGKPKSAVNPRRPRSPSEVVRRRTQYTKQSWKDSSEKGFFKTKAIAREIKSRKENMALIQKAWRAYEETFYGDLYGTHQIGNQLETVAEVEEHKEEEPAGEFAGVGDVKEEEFADTFQRSCSLVKKQ